MKKFRFPLAMLAITLAFVTCGGKAAPASDFSYVLTADGTGIVINQYTGNGGSVVIPAEIEGIPVVRFGIRAFYGEDDSSYGPGYNITSVVIPASVKRIESRCFSWIENLTSVTILGTGVELDQLVFGRAINLTELKIPNGDNVLIPWGAFSTNRNAFAECRKLPLAMRTRLKFMGFSEP